MSNEAADAIFGSFQHFQKRIEMAGEDELPGIATEILKTYGKSQFGVSERFVACLIRKVLQRMKELDEMGKAGNIHTLYYPPKR